MEVENKVNMQGVKLRHMEGGGSTLFQIIFLVSETLYSRHRHSFYFET